MDFLKYHASSRLTQSLLLCYCGGKNSVCFVGDKSRRKLFQLSIKCDRLEAIWRSLGDSSRTNLSAWHCVEVLGRNAFNFHLNVSHFSRCWIRVSGFSFDTHLFHFFCNFMCFCFIRKVFFILILDPLEWMNVKALSDAADDWARIRETGLKHRPWKSLYDH